MGVQLETSARIVKHKKRDQLVAIILGSTTFLMFSASFSLVVLALLTRDCGAAIVLRSFLPIVMDMPRTTTKLRTGVLADIDVSR